MEPMFSSCQKIGTKVSNRFNTNLCLMKILTVKNAENQV
ncbi:UNVERIFIED_ORG: hypothetical protein QQG_3964 [Clostridioides difficile Y384]